MTDLTVGLSKAAVEALVNKFKSAIEEEEEQWQIVQRDMVFIIDEFDMMQSFLSSVDGERVKNIVVRTWVRQVRDLSYDVEDCIEFVLHLDTTKRSWWLRLLPSCGKTRTPLPIDEAVSEIKLLKARVEDVSQRNMRYNLISDSGSKSFSQVQRKASSSTSTLDILMDAAKMEKGLLDLVKLITMDVKDLQVISVCGTGGDHGKISIIKNVYDDPKVCENFRSRAWVKLTHPFNPHEFIRNLVVQFYTNCCQEQDGVIIGLDVLTKTEVTHDDLVNMYKEQVNKQRYLVILEDLFSMVQWVAIKSYLPDRKNGSRIIVSTNQLEIASLCTGKPYSVLELSQLSADHSVCVFFKELSQRDEVSGRGGPSAERKAVRNWVVNALRVGQDAEADKLDEQITSRRYADKPHIVSVLGISDVETSALVRTVYCRNVVLQKFQKYAWVNVSHAFDVSNFYLWLFCQLYEGPELDYLILMTNWIERLRELLHKQRCLIIIDGLKSKEDWDRIKNDLISESSSSSIVVISREESIATYCAVADDVVCKINGLEADAARQLYNEKGFQRDDVRCPHWVDNLHLFGRDLDSNELFNQMKNYPVVSVWGFPGVGKSALSRAVYFQHMLINDFEKYAWVNVYHPFNLINFCQQLLSSLHVEIASETYPKALQVGDQIQECWKLLHGHRCLVVSDGLQSKEDWDTINAKLIFQHSRSCTVVITTKANVTTHCAVTEDAVYNVKALDNYASLHLLINKAFEGTEVHLYRNMLREAEHIAHKCGGLPKVIVALAGYLASRPRDIELRMRNLDANFMHELETNRELDCLQGVLTWMHSYLDACPSYLKKCMLYVSIFPPDMIIRQGRLIRRWIAEGYSKGKDSNSLVKYAKNLYNEFVALNIMNPAPRTSEVAGYQVNGFFREYIISRPMEEKIFFPLEVSALEKGDGGLNTEGMGQHLILGSTWLPDQIFFESLDFSRLRSLTAFNIFWPFYLSDKIKVLRVLDLENANGVDHNTFEEIEKLPPRLKFLSLRGQDVHRLPDSVGGLMQLQALDIRGTYIKTLPQSITKLQKLQYIRAGTRVLWTGDEGSAAEEEQSSGC
ncbi:hypothetical protein ACP4OV_008891 [Aristida adscensionis]